MNPNREGSKMRVVTTQTATSDKSGNSKTHLTAYKNQLTRTSSTHRNCSARDAKIRSSVPSAAPNLLREFHLTPRQKEVPRYSHTNHTLIVQLERHCPKMRFETISLVTRLIQIRDI